MNYQSYQKYLINWLQTKVKKANAQGVLVGVSGGVDSSVVASLAKTAFPNNSIGVILPIENMNQDLEDAQIIINQIKIKSIMIDLTNIYKTLIKKCLIKNTIAKNNIKPRLRMTTFYAIAQDYKYLVLGTSNAAELLLGYFTKHGDSGVDLMPLGSMTKGEVQEMAKFMQLPKRIYTKIPSAGLWEGQTDEQELGVSYKDVDKYLKNKNIDKVILDKIHHLQEITNHKRKTTPIPKKYF